jgi:segregation and condensation protein B
METLAVVAYRQPVLRVGVEAIRGVQCGEILRQLMERDLVRIVGRSEELGRPLLYGTTRRFLEVFGLRHLDELPRLNQPIHSSKTEGDSNVKTVTDTKVVLEDALGGTSAAMLEEQLNVVAGKAGDEDDLDASEEEDEDDEEDDIEDEDEELEDDEDLEEDDWEEVEEEDEDLEDLDEEEEEEEEEEDDDWEDDDWEDEEEDQEVEEEKGKDGA